MKSIIRQWLGILDMKDRVSDAEDQLVFMRQHIARLEAEIRELRAAQRRTGFWMGSGLS